jgi:predicted transcriptional regulator
MKKIILLIIGAAIFFGPTLLVIAGLNQATPEVQPAQQVKVREFVHHYHTYMVVYENGRLVGVVHAAHCK